MGPHKFARYNRERSIEKDALANQTETCSSFLVITEFVITKFDCISFLQWVISYLFFLEKVFDLEGFRPFGIETIFDLLRPSHLLPLTTPAGLDVEDADGGRRPGEPIAFSKSAEKEEKFKNIIFTIFF